MGGAGLVLLKVDAWHQFRELGYAGLGQEYIIPCPDEFSSVRKLLRVAYHDAVELTVPHSHVSGEFHKWITSEVLPSIRRTGKYAVPVQPELPLEGWKIRNGQRVIPLSKVAKKMNLRYSQAYGLCYRHKKEFRAGTDIVRFGDSLYLTEPGTERMAELAKRVDFHEFRAPHRRALPSVPRRDPDIVGIQFQEQGYTEAFYLTYQMLLNWYSLNENQMRTAVSDLERLSGAETKELPSVAGATQTFCAVSSFSAVVDHMKKHLFNMVKSNLENEKQTIVLRLPKILVDEIMQKKTKPPLDGFCQTELAYPTKV